ncbi:acetolactate synthase [Marinobacter sp. C1S70]|uniref:ACT domain-containing protein n=1 Tax=Marinobacter sp. C1S70 TaxID=1396859 RepID=UPI0003B8777B|nr:ACT domain-containing protein [Marinobacter sp. C1S70]ERS90701.1 acetolactate synthase [Marinobacter sp. C1S70]
MKPNHEISSQRYTLNCRMNQEAAALERLCRVVRVRGFRISKMAMESTGDTLDIALTLEGSRPVAMLQSQLEKLHTVAGVELVSDTMARSRTA